MKILGIRFCRVSTQAEQLAGFLGTEFGMPAISEELGPPSEDRTFSGSVFPAGEHSWIEIWKAGDNMPSGDMLQIIVDDADAWAKQARQQGVKLEGPMDAHGERIYFMKSPDGLAMSFQSKVANDA